MSKLRNLPIKWNILGHFYFVAVTHFKKHPLLLLVSSLVLSCCNIQGFPWKISHLDEIRCCYKTCMYLSGQCWKCHFFLIVEPLPIFTCEKLPLSGAILYTIMLMDYCQLISCLLFFQLFLYSTCYFSDFSWCCPTPF